MPDAEDRTVHTDIRNKYTDFASAFDKNFLRISVNFGNQNTHLASKTI